jgi:CheY-like chemotaxis protein
LTRATWCLEALRPFGLGALVARDGDEAIEIIRHVGVPVLLLTDLSLPKNDAFVVMEALRHTNTECGIVVVSAFRDARQYAAQRTDLGIAAVVSPSVSHDELREAIRRALPQANAPKPPASRTAYVTEIMRDAVEEAARLATTPGAALYLKLPGEERFRAQVTWASDVPGGGSPFAAPRIFDWVMEAGEAIVLPDVARQPLAAAPAESFHAAVRGLVAAPVITPDRATVGAICAFDVKPLAIGTMEVEAIQALGRWVGSFLSGSP